MNDNFKFYEDENIEAYTSGAVFRKNDKLAVEIMKDLAMKNRCMLDILGLFFKEYDVSKDEFAEVCHKTFGFYARHFKQLFDQMLISEVTKMECKDER